MTSELKDRLPTGVEIAMEVSPSSDTLPNASSRSPIGHCAVDRDNRTGRPRRYVEAGPTAWLWLIPAKAVGILVGLIRLWISSALRVS